ncbi:MAG: hypothetical protein HC869_00290, partial [Rhodospirillales bacterium]|nr:hypothetical protein [Rhodospirillales bacterium]
MGLLIFGAISDAKSNWEADQILRGAGLSRGDVESRFDERIPADATIQDGMRDLNERRVAKNGLTSEILHIWDTSATPQEAYARIREAYNNIGKNPAIADNSRWIYQQPNTTQTTGKAPPLVLPDENTPRLPGVNYDTTGNGNQIPDTKVTVNGEQLTGTSTIIDPGTTTTPRFEGTDLAGRIGNFAFPIGGVKPLVYGDVTRRGSRRLPTTRLRTRTVRSCWNSNIGTRPRA